MWYNLHSLLPLAFDWDFRFFFIFTCPLWIMSHFGTWTWIFHVKQEPDKDFVIYFEHSMFSFLSSFQDMSDQVLFWLVTEGCQLLWHSITPLVPAITEVLQLGQTRSLHPFTDWLFGLVKRASFAAWNKMLSTTDRDHEYSAMGLAPCNIFFYSFRVTGENYRHMSKHLCLCACLF